MAKKTSTKSTKVARKAAARRVAAKVAKPDKTASTPQSGRSGKPTLLAGGNPQIAKGYGDAPVQAYIGAMPGWKRDIGRRLDALIVRAVPGVRKAVKWNSPLYGMEGEGWFLGIHCFTNYVKMAFFRGTSLRPVPPRRFQAKGRALLPHPGARPPRRSSARRLGEASEPLARRTNVSGERVGRMKRAGWKAMIELPADGAER